MATLQELLAQYTPGSFSIPSYPSSTLTGTNFPDSDYIGEALRTAGIYSNLAGRPETQQLLLQMLGIQQELLPTYTDILRRSLGQQEAARGVGMEALSGLYTSDLFDPKVMSQVVTPLAQGEVVSPQIMDYLTRAGNERFEAGKSDILRGLEDAFTSAQQNVLMRNVAQGTPIRDLFDLSTREATRQMGQLRRDIDTSILPLALQTGLQTKGLQLEGLKNAMALGIQPFESRLAAIKPFENLSQQFSPSLPIYSPATLSAGGILPFPQQQTSSGGGVFGQLLGQAAGSGIGIGSLYGLKQLGIF